MDNIKNDAYYIDKIKYSIDRIDATMDGISYDEFINDSDKQDITMFHLIQISENAKKISDEYKKEHNSIPWGDIYGLRNKLVHDYGNVVLDIVYDTLTIDIPYLKNTL